MYKFLRLVLILALLIFSISVFGQIVSVFPKNATTDSDVTITFNAAIGNQQLKGYTEDVYAYTGVITSDSNGDHDWKHVQNDWGVVNPKTLMTSLGNGLYSIDMNIRDFYDIQSDEIVLKIAFLFHDASYSKIARTETGGDIFLTINKLSTGNYVSHILIQNQLKISTDEGLFLLSFYNDEMLKVEFVPNASTVPDTSFSVVMTPENLSINLDDETKFIRFSSDKLDVIIEKSPIRIKFVNSTDTILKEYKGIEPNIEGGSISFQINTDEHFYGGGSRAIPIDRKGSKLKIYNEAHYGYGNNTETLNISIPHVVSNKKYALFFDNQYPAYLDLGLENPEVINYIADGGRLRYYFISGETNNELLNSYTDLTGKQSLPPIWALGYIQSKFGYENETDARNIVNKIQQNDFPLDALILDLYWFGTTNDMGNLNWDYSNWANPVQMMSDFKNKNVKTILITEPYFTLNSTNYQFLVDNDYLAWNEFYDPYVLWGYWAGDASLIDITNVNAQSWFLDYYRDRHNEGVSGWWCDLGEPENHPLEMQHQFGPAKSVHNVYSLIWAKLIDDYYKQNYPQERLFNLIRSGYAGMQKFSTFPWSGDVQRSFDGLKAQIPIMLGMSMNGIGYIHSDVGGFTGSDMDSELFTRWVQFGVFAPILRMHGVGTTEPVNFPDPYKSIMRNYIKLRYRMIPYNYTLAYENSLNGKPLAKQLNYYEPENELLSNINDSYFWGDNLLIAPILDRSISSRSVRFPSGKWINFHSNKIYAGNQNYVINSTINDIPIFVKAGSFIPMSTQLYSMEAFSSDTLITHFYPDQSVTNSSYNLFVDDGKSKYTIENQDYEMIHYLADYNGSVINIEISKSGNGFIGAPLNREMQFNIYRISNEPNSVIIDAVEILKAGSEIEFNIINPSFYYNSSDKLLYVHTNWTGSNAIITINDAFITTEENKEDIIADFYLHDPSPNPFKGFTEISADIYSPGKYSLRIYSVEGILIESFFFNESFSGRISYKWNPGNGLKPGMYFIRFSNDSRSSVKKVIKY